MTMRSYFITTNNMKDKNIKKIRFGKENNITDDTVNATNQSKAGKYNSKALEMIKEKSKNRLD